MDDSDITNKLFEILKQDKPPTVSELFKKVKIYFPEVKDKQIITLTIKLEKVGKINFVNNLNFYEVSPSVFLKKALWFWITTAFSIIALISILTISENFYPLVYLRWVFGFIFIMFLPGYVVTKIIFPFSLSLKKFNYRQYCNLWNNDLLARLFLSFCLNLAIVPFIGFLLNYTPFGITIIPVSLSLFFLIMFLAILSLVREYYNYSNEFICSS